MAKESPITKEDGWFAGEDKALRFTVVDEAEAIVNITGWNFKWSLLMGSIRGTEVASKTSGAGISIINAAGGVVQVVVAAADTHDLEPRTHYHVLSRTDSGNVQVLAYGSAELMRATI